MFGFACDETPELMPLPIQLSQKLSHRLSTLRKTGKLNWLKPDGKSQVSVEYNDRKPIKVNNVVIATQHKDMLNMLKTEKEEHKFITENITKEVIKPVLDEYAIDYDENFIVNGTGRFVVGGPLADTGLTGRKIIVDTYGGAAPHGGGAFSGKDPSKVDRSAAYVSRYLAKNIVAAGLADRWPCPWSSPGPPPPAVPATEWAGTCSRPCPERSGGRRRCRRIRHLWRRAPALPHSRKHRRV
mgnify:CR=1 FL=1